MNGYFNAPATPVDFTRAKAAAVKALFASIASAFDMLPASDVLAQGRVNYAVAAGSGNTLTTSLTLAPAAYVDGLSVRLKLAFTNTGAATLNVNGLGAKSIVKSDGTALVGGELAAGAIQTLTYDGTVFRINATGPIGPIGPAGPASATQLLNGAADPVGGTGSNGDFYINTATWKIFGPKAAGAWPAGVNIIGANGANGANGTNGSTVLNGAGAPGGGTGANGDFYVDTTAHAIYGPKTAGAWGAGTSLIGPAGAAGAAGAAGPTANVTLTGTSFYNDGNGAMELGSRDLLISRTIGNANFTLAAADRGKAITYTDTGDTCTVPLNATVAIGVGAIISIANIGSGPLTIARELTAPGVIMKLAGTGADANRTLAVGGVCWIWKIATNTWFIGGTGVS